LIITRPPVDTILFLRVAAFITALRSGRNATRHGVVS
jgi:hypothetical protein